MADDVPVIPDRRREALLRQVSLVNGGVVYIYDINTLPRFDRSNLAMYLTELLGYPVGHADGAGVGALRRLAHPDDWPKFGQHRRAVAKLPDGEFATLVCRMLHIDGRWRWIEARERVFSRSRAGEVRRVLGFAADVSERRRMADSLAGATNELLVAEAQERRRIARDLHDSTTQHLVAIDLTMSRLERRIGDDPIDHAIVADIRAALAAAHREIRTFSYLLHPPQLEKVGLEATLNQFLEGFQRRTGLHVSFQVQGPPRVLGQVTELALFRVAQEALMNVHKHARASDVDIRLANEPFETVLEIRDDGVGIPEAEVDALLASPAAGVGIASMKARITDLGGVLRMTPQAKGLLIRAVMPRRRVADALKYPDEAPSEPAASEAG